MVRPALAAAALLVITARASAETELDLARAACEKDFKACARVEQLEIAERAENERKGQAELARQHAAAEAALARARDQEEADRRREEALQKKCGKDYQRVRVGMKFDRVRECAGPFEIAVDDAQFRIYRGAGGLVRVEHGKVVRVVFQ